MKSLYYLMMFGLIVCFGIVIYGAFLLLSPVNISQSDGIDAIPTNVKSGQLVKYTIRDCEDSKYIGTVSVNLQSTDVPPSVTVAVAAPLPQQVHCTNIVLVPATLPTGKYRLVVFVRYRVNSVRDTLNPVRGEYSSNIINVTNSNPDYVLPKIAPKPIVQPTIKNTQAKQAPTTTPSSPSAPHTPATSQAPAKNPLEATVDSILDGTKSLIYGLTHLGGK